MPPPEGFYFAKECSIVPGKHAEVSIFLSTLSLPMQKGSFSAGLQSGLRTGILVGGVLIIAGAALELTPGTVGGVSGARLAYFGFAVTTMAVVGLGTLHIFGSR